MSKHDDLDQTSASSDDSWIREIGRSDDTLDTPRHLFYGIQPLREAQLEVRAQSAATVVDAEADADAAMPKPAATGEPVLAPETAATTESAATTEPAAGVVETVPAPKRSRRLRKPLLIAAAAAIGLLTVGAGTMTALSKDVAIVVDGQTQHVRTMSGTVAGALSAAGLSPHAHDALAPAGSTSIADGSTIVLDRGRQLTLTIDGKKRDVWTTARTVDQAMQALGIRAGSGTELQLSANRSRAIPLDGLVVTGTSLRSVSVAVGGTAPVAKETSATTVGALLAERKIALGPLDVLTPSASTPLTTGLTITIDRVRVATKVTTVKIAQPVENKVNDPALDKGTSKVVQHGAAGSQSVSYQITIVNGKQTATKETGRQTVLAAKPTIIHVGTKVPPPASPAAAATAASKFTYVGDEVFTNDTTFGVNWDGLAMCESTHNPKAVNANPSAGLPTYGLFQFDIPTWASVGGSGNPMDATPEEQLMRAKLLFQQRGLEPWACRDAAE